MHIRLSLILIMLSFGVSYAQPFTIKGSVSDTVNNFPLENASVTLIRAKDSVLETFTRTKQDGSFSLQTNSKDKYIVTIAYPGFVDYIDRIETKDEPLDLGALPMVSKTHLLQEFVYTEQFAAIKVKGDTVEYVADSFKTQSGANVESLLKKLPGLQVDKNGKIIAQGETVQKLLVDGEEFFSDDPAVVSKNLQAAAVDKVQVFDKKSEQAEFTGIDDGEKIRTINVQLKENSKKGYFGKLSAGAGAGTDRNFYENQGMFNAFKGKRKFSAFGIMANTGRTGLGWEDQDKYGSGGSVTMIEDGGMMHTFGGDDDDNGWDGRYNGQGLPKAWTGGLHYSNKWNKDVNRINGNYRFAKQEIETIHNILTENFLPGTAKYFTEQNNQDVNIGTRNKMDGLYEWKPDTTSELRVTANANHSLNSKRSNYFSESYTNNEGGKQAMNDSRRTVTNDGTNIGLNSTLSWRKKMKKHGRTISLNFNERYSENESEGYLQAYNNYYNNGGSNDTINQLKQNNNSSLSLSNNISYTEPLSKSFFIEARYEVKVDNNTAEKNTYNKTNPLSDVYDSIDMRYTSNYSYDILTNTGGSTLRYSGKKFSFNVGGSVSNARFIQKDMLADTLAKYSFLNFFPSANLNYKISKQTYFNFYYRGYTSQPSLSQIQPLQDNTDPLNVAIGNPYLTQEFRNNFSLSFNDYKVLSGRYIWASANFSTVDNAISRAMSVDAATGRTTYQYINVDGNFTTNAYASMGQEIKSIGMHVGVNGNIYMTHTNNVVNGAKNITNYNSYSIGLNASYDTDDDKFEVSFNPRMQYNDNSAQVNTQVTSYWTSNNDFNISYEFPLKIRVSSEIEWVVRQRTSIFDQNNSVFRWNAFVSKKFLKNDQLELKASVYDILNQNIGFDRYTQNNYITQDNYNSIRRFGLLTLSWNFTNAAPAAATPDMGGSTIIIEN